MQVSRRQHHGDPVDYKVINHQDLSAEERDAIVALCSRAYEEEFGEYFAALAGGTHLLLYEGNRLVSHACWVDRLLQQEGHEPLRTAYVEAVATEEDARGKGYATMLMQAIAERVQTYPLAALSPADTTLYARLGWLAWRGPLSVRTAEGVEPAPDEEAMVLITSATPAWLDLDAPLSCEWREGPEQW